MLSWEELAEHTIRCISDDGPLAASIAEATREPMPEALPLPLAADWLVRCVLEARQGVAEHAGDLWVYAPSKGIWERLERPSILSSVLLSWQVYAGDKKDGEPKFAKYASAISMSSGRAVTEALVEAAAAVRSVEHWNGDGLVTAKGYITTREGRVVMLEPSPEHLATHAEPRFDISPEAFEFWKNDPTAGNPPRGIWQEALERVMPGDKTAGFLELLGAAKLGFAPQFQSLRIYHGTEGTGKTTLIAQAADDVLGEAWERIEIGQANQSEDSKSRYGVARLENKRLAIFDDSAGSISGSALKQFISTDKMVVRAPGKSAKTIRITWGALLICNEPPQVSELDQAALDRIAFIETGSEKLRGTSAARFPREVVEEYQRSSILHQAIYHGVRAIERRAYTEAADDAANRQKRVAGLDDFVAALVGGYAYSESVEPIPVGDLMKDIRRRLVEEGLTSIASEKCGSRVAFGRAMSHAAKVGLGVAIDDLRLRKSNGVHYRLYPVNLSQN